MNKAISKELFWSNYENCSHGYLFPCIEKITDKYFSKSIRILDAGCGSGFILNKLINKGFKNVYGFDISVSGIDLAKKNNPDFAERFFTHDSYDVNLPKGIVEDGFDLVLSSEVMEHLYSPSIYLKNVNKWLKKDGYLILTTPYHGYLKNLLITISNKFDTHFDPLFEGGHIKFFSKKTLYKQLMSSRMEPLEFNGVGRVSYLWKSMIVLAKKT